MPINIMDNQSAGQIAGNNASVLGNSIKQLDTKKGAEDLKKLETADEVYEHMMEGSKSADKASTDVLRALLNKAAQHNISLKKIKDDPYNEMQDDQDNAPKEDQITISSRFKETEKKQSVSLGDIIKKSMLPKDAEPILQRYFSIIADKEHFKEIDKKKNLDKQIEELEVQLTNKGVSKEAINSIKKQIISSAGRVSVGIKENSQIKEETKLNEKINIKMDAAKNMKEQIIKNIRDSVLAREFAQSKLESVMADNQGFAQIDEYLINIMGIKKNSREYVDARNKLVADAQSLALKEMNEFSYDSLEQTFIQKCLKGDMSINDKPTADLIKLARKSGNIGKWIQNVWMPNKDNMGFVEIDVPDGNSSMLNVFKQRQREGGHKGQQDEEESESMENVLKSRLFAVLLSGFLKPGIWNKIDTHFKVMGLEKDLKKLGISTEVIGSIKEQAKQSATVKGREILFEAYLEMMTIVHDKTLPAYQLVEKKINNTKKAMEDLGVQISDQEMALYRQKASIQMKDVISAQIKSLENNIFGNNNKNAENSLKMLRQLLAQINAELGIENTEFGEDGQQLVA